jgi:hypothetical protein
MKSFKKFLIEVTATKRVGIQHLNKIPPMEFLELLNYFKNDLKGIIKKEHITASEKIDGFGLRMGHDAEGKFFIESSHSGPVYDVGAFSKYTKLKKGNVDDVSKAYDIILKAFKKNKQLNKILEQYNDGGIKVIGEMMYTPLGIVNKDKIRFIAIDYDKSKLGEVGTFVLFKVVDKDGNQLPDSAKIIKEIQGVSSKEYKFTGLPSIDIKNVNIKYEIDNFMKVFSKFKNVETILKSRKPADREAKNTIKQLVEKLQNEIGAKIIKGIKGGAFGPEIEGIVAELANGKSFKIISKTFTKRKFK